MKKLITTTIIGFAALTSVTHAKIYSFEDFSADFPIEPGIESNTTDFGVDYKTYAFHNKNVSVSVNVYNGVMPAEKLDGERQYEFGRAKGTASDRNVFRADGDFKGYPSIRLGYQVANGYVAEVHVYTRTRIYLIMGVANKGYVQEMKDRLIEIFDSIEFKDAPGTTQLVSGN